VMCGARRGGAGADGSNRIARKFAADVVNRVLLSAGCYRMDINEAAFGALAGGHGVHFAGVGVFDGCG
jgi:hypothetical protein